MKRKRWLILISLLVLSAILASMTVGCAESEPATTPAPTAEVIELKMVTFVPTNLPENDAPKQLIEMVNERSNGQLIINLIGGPETIPGFEQPEAVRSGVADICVAVPPYYTPIVPAISIQQHMEVNLVEVYQNGLYDLWNAEFEKQGLSLTGFAGNSKGFYYFTKDKIEKPADLNGVKMRGGVNYKPLMDALGVVQVDMPMGDAYEGLQRGVIDGICIVQTEVQNRKLFETVRFCIDHPVNNGMALTIAMNLNKFQSLPTNLQELLIQAGYDAGLWAEEQIPSIEAESRKFLLEEAGIEYVKFSAADEKFWYDTYYEVQKADLLERCPDLGEKLWELSMGTH